MNRRRNSSFGGRGTRLAHFTHRFASDKEDFARAIEEIGIPCVVKPIMSSSGKGQSVVRSKEEVDYAWNYAQQGGRAGQGKSNCGKGLLI